MAGGRPKKPPTSFPMTYEPKDLAPDVSIYDTTNPLSVINMVEEGVARGIMGIPPKYLKLTEKELRKEVKPDETLCRLKLSFWDEYARAQESKPKRKIHITKVTAGICLKEFFYEVVLRDPLKLVWVVTPPVDHMIQLREILDLGLNRLREMIQLPFVYREVKVDKNGDVKKVRKVDARVMAQVNNAVNTLLDRVHGAVMQKIAVNQQSLNVNLNKNEDVFDTASLESLDAMERKLNELTGMIKETMPALIEGETIDVLEVSEDGELDRVVGPESS
jgi:hypothetical protein